MGMHAVTSASIDMPDMVFNLYHGLARVQMRPRGCTKVRCDVESCCDLSTLCQCFLEDGSG